MGYIRLGEGLAREPEPEPTPEVAPAGPSPEELFAHAVHELRDALSALPPPVVTTESIDLAEIVNAIQGLKGPATAEEIADAIARRIVPGEPQGESAVVSAIREMAEKIDFRMKGVGGGAAFGASGPSNIASDPNREVGRVSVTNLVETSVSNFPATQPVSGEVELGSTSLAALESTTATLASSSAYIGYVSQGVVGKVNDGRTVNAAINYTNPTIGAISVHFYLENPTGSGRVFTFRRAQIAATSSTRFAAWTQTAPTATAVTSYNLYRRTSGNITATGLVGYVAGDATTYSGDPILAGVAGTAGFDPLENVVMLLAANQRVTFLVPALAQGATLTVNLSWTED